MANTSTDYKYDAFISYKRGDPDEAFARDLLARLEAAGYKVAFDQRDFRANQPFLDEMERCVVESRFTLAVVSPRYFESGNTTKEARIRTVLDMADRTYCLIPLIIADGKWPIWVHELTGIDFRTDDPLAPPFAKLTDTLGSPLAASVISEPATARSLWNVPYTRNAFFTGRVEILARLRAALATGKPAALTQAISGLGGIGKTQTAIEYAYLHRDEYDAVFWVSAATTDSITSGFAAIAGLLQLPEAPVQDQNIAVAAAKRWLQSNERWLLILDNADDAEIAKSAVMDRSPGHVLITSRLQSLRALGVASPIVLHEMPPDDAIQFLLESTGRAGVGDAAGIAELAAELGYLPLALEQSAAYIAVSGSTFADYLASYRKNKLDLLEKGTPEAGGYRETVRVTWTMNFEAVKRDSPASADVLYLSAFLAPDAIPYETLIKGATGISPAVSRSLAGVADDPLLLDELLLPLTRYFLIRRDPATRCYTMHRLVQLVIRDGLSMDDRRAWAEHAMLAINSAFPNPPEFENWPLCDKVLPHARVCAEHIDEYSFEIEETALLLALAAYYMNQRAQYTAAEPLYKRALTIREKVLGPEQPATASSLNNLALLYHHQSNQAAAEPLYQRALEIRETILGPEHPGTATTLNNLGGLYKNQGSYAAAEPLYKRALAIREKALGPEHPDTAQSLNNLAELYRAQGNYAAAEPLCKRALEIREKALGPEHPDTATSLNNLAGLYAIQGDYAAAEPLYVRVLEIQMKARGPEHPYTTTTLASYANLLRAMGRDDEAAVLKARAAAGRAEHERRNRS